MFEDLFAFRRPGGPLSDADLDRRRPRVEWNPPGECDWPVCYEFYPDFHYHRDETYEIPSGCFPPTIWEPEEERRVHEQTVDLGSGMPPVMVGVFWDGRCTDYRFEFSSAASADTFSISLMATSREPRADWHQAAPIQRMLRVIARAFEEIVVRAEEAGRSGWLVRVGYRGDETEDAPG